MPTFETPEPISVTIALAAGNARITASDRTNTIVEVLPSDATCKSDVREAEQTRVDYADGGLRIKTPQHSGLRGRGGSVDIAIELPAGSRVHGDAAYGVFRSEGRLGACTLTTAAGDIRLDETGALHVGAASGGITVGRAVGAVDVKAGAGEVRITEIEGTAVIKCSSGNNWIGEVTGDLIVNTAYGDISVDRAHAGVTAKTAAGSVRIGEVARGRVVLETAAGQLEVGIREGTAAWLDARAITGRVCNYLPPSGVPGASDETVEVRARTALGDIVIRRS